MQLRNFHEIVDLLALLSKREYRPGSLTCNFWVWEESPRPQARPLFPVCIRWPEAGADGVLPRQISKAGCVNFGIPGPGLDGRWWEVAWLQSLRGCWLICMPVGLMSLAGRLAPESLPGHPSLCGWLGCSHLSAIGGQGCGGGGTDSRLGVAVEKG